jgi:hypothetical protein
MLLKTRETKFHVNHHLETPRCSLEIMFRYSFGFACHCGGKSPGIGICAKLRYTVYLFRRLVYNFQSRISHHSLTSSCQIYPYFGSHVTGPDQGFPLGFLVSPPCPHTKALGTRLRKLFYVFDISITRTTAP